MTSLQNVVESKYKVANINIYVKSNADQCDNYYRLSFPFYVLLLFYLMSVEGPATALCCAILQSIIKILNVKNKQTMFYDICPVCGKYNTFSTYQVLIRSEDRRIGCYAEQRGSNRRHGFKLFWVFLIMFACSRCFAPV